MGAGVKKNADRSIVVSIESLARAAFKPFHLGS